MKKDNSEVPEGFVFLPYVTAMSTEPNPEYDAFMDWYDNEHKYCPKCGGDEYSVTLMGYILYMDNKEVYKDENKCVCSNCGDIHIVHDRIKIKSEQN